MSTIRNLASIWLEHSTGNDLFDRGVTAEEVAKAFAITGEIKKRGIEPSSDEATPLYGAYLGGDRKKRLKAVTERYVDFFDISKQFLVWLEDRARMEEHTELD